MATVVAEEAAVGATAAEATAGNAAEAEAAVGAVDGKTAAHVTNAIDHTSGASWLKHPTNPSGCTRAIAPSGAGAPRRLVGYAVQTAHDLCCVSDTVLNKACLQTKLFSLSKGQTV